MQSFPMESHPLEAVSRALAAGLPRLVVAVVAAGALAACVESAAREPAVATTYGAPVPVGNGTARVYLVMDGGAPAEVGVALSEAALQGLPADHSPGGTPMPDGHHTFDYLLQMPAGNPTPYRFVGLDWNPAGHEPPGIYDQPHFDFHFYSVTEAERSAILPSDPEFAAKAARAPAPEFVPPGYVQVPGAVPLMGAHWVDPTSPEHNGEIFARTFLYGSWDGELIFAEPMITRAFLETKPDFRAPIPTPARHRTPGYYPTAYRVYWNAEAGEYRVALAGLERRG